MHTSGQQRVRRPTKTCKPRKRLQQRRRRYLTREVKSYSSSSQLQKSNPEITTERQEVRSTEEHSWRDANPGIGKLQYALKNSLYTDLKVVVYNKNRKDKVFKAHSLVLFSQSGIFDHLLSSESGKVTLTLYDTEHEAFQVFLEGLYWEYKVVDTITLTQMLLVWSLTEKYKVNEFYVYIKGKVLSFLDHNKGSAAEILQTCIVVKELEIARRALEVIIYNTEPVLKDASFVHLSKETVELIVKQDYLSANEPTLWDAVCKWGVGQSKEKKGTVQEAYPHLDGIIHEVRFLSMSVKEFAETAGSSQLLKKDEQLSLFLALSVEKPDQFPPKFNRSKRISVLCMFCNKPHCKNTDRTKPTHCIKCKKSHCGSFKNVVQCSVEYCHDCNRCQCCNRYNYGYSPYQTINCNRYCDLNEEVCQNCNLYEDDHCSNSVHFCNYCKNDHCQANDMHPVVKACLW